MRLIAAKLDPPRTPTKFVVRDRLHAKLDRGSGRQLTVVVGPAGSGKSAMLASWMSRRSILGNGAWLTLDEFDNEPVRLWTYLLAALRRSMTGLARPSLLENGVDAELISEMASAVGGLSTPLVLVLDNVQHLGEGPAADSIASLLQYSMPMLHLVLSSRSEPPLPLGRLRLTGELARVEAEELAFTASEAAQLWALRSRPLRHDEARALVAQTEGWAAGLCLRAQGEKGDAFADFFRGEVMAGQTARMREFLLRSSVVGALTADLANALTQRHDGAPDLERLRRESLLVQTQPGWWRYRQPFLGFLRDEARLTLGDELPQLHLRAAHWYAAHGEPIHAVEHAIAAEAWEEAAKVVVQHAPARFYSRSRDSLRELIGRLPKLAAAQDPQIAAALALHAADRGDAHEAQGFLTLARQSGDLVTAEHRPAWQAVLHLTDLMLARQREQWPAVHAAAAQLTALLDGAPPGLVLAAEELRLVALEHVGQAWWWEAEFEQARHCLREAVEGARRHGLDLVEVTALGALALLEATGGYLHEAGRAANAAVRLLEPAGRLRSKYATQTLLALALIQWLRGHPVKAGQRLAAAHAANKHEPSHAGSAFLASMRAMLALSQAELAAAHSALTESKADADDEPQLVSEWLTAAQAQVFLREGHPAAALTMLNPLPQPAGPLAARAVVLAGQAHVAAGAPAQGLSLVAKLHGRADPPTAAGPWAQAAAWLVHALAAERLGHDGAVRIALSEALSTAAAEDLFEPFTGAGMPLAALLDRHSDLLAGRGAFGRRLGDLLHWPQAAAHPGSPVLEQITEREAMVLRYLPTLLTMKEIAGELSVSPNTVKSHLRNLYRKLAVRSRRDAVQQARKLGLLRADKTTDRAADRR